MRAEVTTAPTTRASASRPLFFLLGYCVTYCALLLSMHRFERFDIGEPLLVLGLLGVGFSALAWWVTRNSVPLPFAVQQPARETLLLLLYILPLIAYLHGAPKRWRWRRCRSRDNRSLLWPSS